MHRALRWRSRRRSRRRSARRRGRPCAPRDATAGGRSRSAAGRARWCWCGGRSTSARPSAGCANSPARIFRCTHWWLGLKRRVWPTIATLPGCAAAAARTASASARLSASGISTCTCLPAARHAIACAACSCVGVHRITASTSRQREALGEVVGDVRRCRTSPRPRCVLPSSRPTSETTSTPSISRIASRCLMPNAPAPASATL